MVFGDLLDVNLRLHLDDLVGRQAMVLLSFLYFNFDHILVLGSALLLSSSGLLEDFVGARVLSKVLIFDFCGVFHRCSIIILLFGILLALDSLSIHLFFPLLEWEIHFIFRTLDFLFLFLSGLVDLFRKFNVFCDLAGELGHVLIFVNLTRHIRVKLFTR